MNVRIAIDGREAGVVAADDRGLLYGDGLFETIALRNGGLRFLDRHRARLRYGCGRLGIAVDESVVAATIAAAVGGTREGVVRLAVTRGRGPRGYAPPAIQHPTVAAFCYPRGVATVPAGPLRVRVCATRVATSPALGGLKTLGRLEHVLARAEWDDPAIGEGLMCDAGGGFVCGTASNLFVVTRGQLVTPPVAVAGVRGIMRGVVLEAAAAAGIPTREEAIDAGLLAEAGEVFMTNALMGLAPVIGIDGRELAVGPVTRRLRQSLAALGVTECAAPC